MLRRVAAFCVMGGVASAVLTGCGDDAKAPGTKPTGSAAGGTAVPPATTPSEQALGGSRLGGAAAGVTLQLPAGWKEVDPTTDTSEVVRTTFRLTGDLGELTKQLMGQQKKQGIVFAIDSSVTSGLAPHLSAGCDRGGTIGASMEQLKAKTQAMHKGARITDLTVGGRPAFKAAYTSAGRDGVTTDEVTVRVPMGDNRFCFVDLAAEQGSLPAQTEQVLASFKVS
ncbi:hypothetical protein GCM10009678_50900 [Actinomadura kijaniata]|uniref:Lipoprotein n=1 Tax=Actinomadura namibiensis TaxID=182080 RepID=A0A7W3LI41_ACTNM|nr:hypothetical protein [Actinomadura namibiensis]MBA8948540.1 hypothetical protein [Actinomadura namibiensis]